MILGGCLGYFVGLGGGVADVFRSGSEVRGDESCWKTRRSGGGGAGIPIGDVFLILGFSNGSLNNSVVVAALGSSGGFSGSLDCLVDVGNILGDGEGGGGDGFGFIDSVFGCVNGVDSVSDCL